MDDKKMENSRKPLPDDIQKLDSDFIIEKIKQRSVNKKKLLRRTIITAAMAVIFALVACLTFLTLEPVISNWLYPEEEPAPIELPAETEEMLPEDMIADDSEILQEMPQAETIQHEEQIEQAVRNLKLDIGDYSDMYSSMAEIAKNAAKSVVTVTGSVSNVDWFNNPYESKDQTSGVIVAKNGKGIYILFNYSALESADSIMVTFNGGRQVKPEMIKRDANTKLAVVSVAESDLDQPTIDEAVAADLTGSSNSVMLPGSPVVAIGNPIGVSDSICYGIVTSNSTVLNMKDANYKLITTDIYGSQNASGILINLNGQVIGILDNSYNNSDMTNLVSAVGITELRKAIERMSNERDQAYLGTYGTDVTLDANETLGVPFGAYITEIEMDSPAMNAGIQSGDIITRIGDKEINTYADLINALTGAYPDQVVTVTLMRQGPDEYMEMQIDVTLGML